MSRFYGARTALAATALLGAAAAAAAYNASRARAAERRYPPVGRFITIEGVRAHVLDVGTGDPIVLIHGNGALIEDMTSSGLVDALAERHRVIVFDRPGFGYSERPRSRSWAPKAQAEFLRAGLRALGVARATMFGHSLGTLVGVEMALLEPRLVRRLVLASGYYFPSPRLDVVMQTPPAIPGLGDVIRYTVSPLLATAMLPRIYETLFAPAPVEPRFEAEFPHGLLLRPSQIRAAAADSAYMMPTAAALAHRYRELAMPLTLVTGDGDRIVDPDNTLRLHHEMPGSRLVVIPGAGHMVHHTAMDAVRDAIAPPGPE